MRLETTRSVSVYDRDLRHLVREEGPRAAATLAARSLLPIVPLKIPRSSTQSDRYQTRQAHPRIRTCQRGKIDMRLFPLEAAVVRQMV